MYYWHTVFLLITRLCPKHHSRVACDSLAFCLVTWISQPMFSLTKHCTLPMTKNLKSLVLKKDIKILSLQSYFHFSIKIYILLGILCLKSSFRSVLDFRVACLSLRNFENSRTFSSLVFSGGLSINGYDDGDRAQTDESTSLGLSNCSRIAGSPISCYYPNH